MFFLFLITPNLRLPLPDKAGKKCKLIDYQRINEKGLSLIGNYLGREIYIYLNYDTNNIVANSLYIMKFVPHELAKSPLAIAFLG